MVEELDGSRDRGMLWQQGREKMERALQLLARRQAAQSEFSVRLVVGGRRVGG
jgi:hypothetical protein